jgi:hypothetical protein
MGRQELSSPLRPPSNCLAHFELAPAQADPAAASLPGTQALEPSKRPFSPGFARRVFGRGLRAFEKPFTPRPNLVEKSHVAAVRAAGARKLAAQNLTRIAIAY